jgi:hypothetical protein
MSNTDGGVTRPGISPEFLSRHGVRHVDKDEAESLLGFKAGGGEWIPYPGSNSRGMLVNDRPYGRLRLDHPRGHVKYLSQRDSGSQLFVPQGPPFGKALIIVEGEYKAMSLCEAGFRAVGIGGITSAMTGGKLIPDLAKIICRYNPDTILFLGDSDTCFLFDLSREAAKLARLLPDGCSLKLPRIPLSMPKGIDDVREALADGFPEFWESLKIESIPVSSGASASALAVEIAKRELPAIKRHFDKAAKISMLIELASYLDPLHLDILAKAASESLDLPVVSFRETAKQIASKRREDQAEKLRQAKASTEESVNDPRPKIELPGSRDRLLSEFGADVGPILAKHGFFAKDRLIVYPDTEKSVLTAITGRAFRTAIEKHIIPFRVVKTRSGEACSFNRTITREDAESLLECPQLIDCLPIIRAVNNARFPIGRAAGHIELLPEGYDSETMIFTTPGGPQVEDVNAADGARFLHELFSEFCFKENDSERAVSVAVSAMLTLFVFHIIPKGALRPGFLYTANAEGSGKTLLARLAIVPRIGYTPTGSLPEQEEEVQKVIFSTAIAGSPVLFLDNIKRHTASGAIEGAMTAPFITGRILGRSQTLTIENMMTVFFTGNGATISPDLRRRVLHVELFLREARSEDRKINHPLDEQAIEGLRDAILSALWSITLAWDKAGRPLPRLKLKDYEPWSDVVCGILEHAGFASPCTRAPSSASGDRDTEEMEELVDILAARKGGTAVP